MIGNTNANAATYNGYLYLPGQSIRSGQFAQFELSYLPGSNSGAVIKMTNYGNGLPLGFPEIQMDSITSIFLKHHLITRK